MSHDELNFDEFPDPNEFMDPEDICADNFAGFENADEPPLAEDNCFPMDEEPPL